MEDIPGPVKHLYEVVAELERSFPERKFTPDGHLVGSLGEVIAQHLYGLNLLPNSTPIHDAKTSYGNQVQIKATQNPKGSVGLRSEPDHLIVLLIRRDGSAEELYNGPGSLAWNAAGKPQSNGQSSISLSKLRRLMESVPEDKKLPTINKS